MDLNRKKDIETHVFQRLTSLGGDPRPSAYSIALSGGPDSMFLLTLMRSWCQENGVSLTAFHVNHALRPEASSEADRIAAWCGEMRVPCSILTWNHGLLSSGIQKKARDARYGLLQEACATRGISHLFLAHHLGDVLETFFMRLNRASGLKGLTALKEKRLLGTLYVMRPLLDLTKQDILEYVKAHHIPFLEDSSNQNTKFTRVQVRHALAEAYPDPSALRAVQQSLKRLTHADEALTDITHAFLKEACTLYPEGYASLNLKTFHGLPLEIRTRALETVLCFVFPQSYPPSFDRLVQICTDLKDDFLKGTTLGGCYLCTNKRGGQKNLWVYREPGAVSSSIPLISEAPFYWDSRFFVDKIEKSGIDLKVKVSVLGLRGMKSLEKETKTSSGLPHKVLLGLPALWKEDKLMDIPLLKGYPRGEKLVTITFSHSALAQVPSQSYCMG